MKLFDNVRRRLVHKLIRPEDGYTYTGLIEGGPIKFYYEENENKYILALTSEAHYLTPTLTGWTDYYTYGTELKEVEFKAWMHGILNNVCDQYYERLDNLSKQELKSLRDYANPESGEKFMITKKSFCNIMEALDSYWTHVRALEGILNVYFEKGMMMDIIDKVIDALEEELEPQFYDPELDFNIDEDPIIMLWLTGSERERTIDGCFLATAEDLYDYLVAKRDEIFGKKVSETP